MTKAQKAILQVVREHKHLPAEAICAEVKKEIPNVSLGTIYRNLTHFADKQVIRRISRSNSPDLFDGNMHPHDHLICIKCGKATDVDLPNLNEFFNTHAGVEILHFELSLHYICTDCKNL